jgi:hypothetical protein
VTQDERLAQIVALTRELDTPHMGALIRELWAIASAQGTGPNPAELLSMADAAALIGVDPSTLRTQSSRGRLRTVKRGRDLYVTRESLHLYLIEKMRTKRGGSIPLPANYRTPAGMSDARKDS